MVYSTLEDLRQNYTKQLITLPPQLIINTPLCTIPCDLTLIIY